MNGAEGVQVAGDIPIASRTPKRIQSVRRLQSWQSSEQIVEMEVAVNSEQTLKLILRLMGSSSLCAMGFVAAPHAWMDSIHASLGMGQLPDAPVVGYLARSTSAFYALLGGLLWVVSFDLGRHRRVLIYLGAAIAVFGVVLFLVDWSEGMPPFWTAWEGPFVAVFGLVLLYLSRGVGVRGGGKEP